MKLTKLKEGSLFGSIKYEDLTEERRTAFALLVEYGIIGILAKGVQSFKCFKESGEEGKKFLDDIRKASATELTKKEWIRKHRMNYKCL